MSARIDDQSLRGFVVSETARQVRRIRDLRGLSKAHIRVEFGFDMVQVAKNRYTSDRFHDFIGFEVSQPVLERAMRKTYGLSLEDTLGR